MTIELSAMSEPLYSVAQIRAAEQEVVDTTGDSFLLMQSAAEAIFSVLSRLFNSSMPIAFICGRGNNGADGLLAARLALLAGYDVKVFCLPALTRQGLVARAYDMAQTAGVTLCDFDQDALPVRGVIVDALLGIGFKAPLTTELQVAISAINGLRDHGCTVVSVDVPSGLDADSGYGEVVVVADYTISLIGAKVGLYLGQGCCFSGKVYVEALGVIMGAPVAYWLAPNRLEKCLPTRQKNAYKGSFGHITVIGGDYSYGGAAVMAAESAAKTGAGMVRLFTRECFLTAALARIPSVMVQGVEGKDDLSLLMKRADVLIVGPGLGRQNWGRTLFKQSIRVGVACVVDADGLYWLSQKNDRLPESSVLTPHLGEAARLLNTSIESVRSAPIEAALSIAKQYQSVCVLKGMSSIIASPSGDVLITGEPESGLAKAGSGDVLTGFIATCMTEVDDLLQATAIAVAWHNRSASRASVAIGARRMQPYDILDYL